MKRVLPAACLAITLLVPASFGSLENLSSLYTEHSVSLRGTIYRQNLRNGRLTLLRTRVSTKDILRILELETGLSFGRNPKLVVLEGYTETGPNIYTTTVEDWNWCVITQTDTIDVTEYFTYELPEEQHTVINERGSRTTEIGLSRVEIGSEVLYFDFNGIAEFTVSDTSFRSGGSTYRVLQQSTSLRRVNGEAQTTVPARVYPMDGSFSIGRGRTKIQG